MGAVAKKGAVALMRRTMKELKKSVTRYETARIEWRAIYKRLAEYKRYVRAKSALESKRDQFGAVWIKLPEDLRAELAHEFWPELDNVEDAFDHNGLPLRTEQQNIRVEGNRVQGPRGTTYKRGI